MLGLLLLAGLGVAAAALVEHVDATPEPEEAEADLPEEGAGTGDLLDEIPATTEPPPEEASQPPAEPAPEGEEDLEAFPEGETGEEADLAAQPLPAPDDLAAEARPEARPPVQSQQGTAGNDSIEGTTGRDLLEGGGGDDVLQGRGGADHLVAFDEGSDTLWGGMGADSLHGYTVNAMPDGDTSFVVEDHEADRLRGGLGADKLWLASDDVGTGGAGADEFHVSWDIEAGHPATITDYHPSLDRIVIEFTSHHADGEMEPITDQEQDITTEPLEDGSGTAICLNGQPVAHVLGTTTLSASDIAVVHL